ncbi:hypothetical protein ACXC9Q_18810 [Kribbella sp. CWNU-51]
MSDREVRMRYEERFDTDAPLPQFGHGVWDSLAGQWVAQRLADPAASSHAAILSLRYEGDAERPDACARYLDTPTPVELHVTARRAETPC